MTENNWISVKERLPKYSKDYLVSDGSACAVLPFSNRSKNWTKIIDFWESSDVTHWQPLPKPPKYKTIPTTV